MKGQRSSSIGLLIPAHLVTLSLLSLWVVFGCGNNGGSGASGATGGDGAAPLFAICGAVFTPDGPSGYLALVPALDSGTNVDVAEVVEFGGGASCGGIEGSGKVFVGLRERPVIQRWGTTDDGTPVLEDEVSLAQLGFTSAFRSRNSLQIVSDTKAYYFSNDGVVVWNPSSMTVERLVTLEGLDEPGLRTAVSFPVRDAERYILPAWYTRADDTRAPLTRLAFVDIESDEVTYSPADNRCAIEWPAVADDGDVYFASTADQGIRVAFGLGGDPPAPPCVVRLRAGSNALDPTYFLDPAAIIEPEFAGALTDGVAAFGFVLGYDESLRPLVDAGSALEALGAPAWRNYGFSLAAPEPETSALQDLPPSSGFPSSATVDGVPYVFLFDSDNGTSRLYDVTDRMRARVGAEAPGLILQALRVL